MSFSPCPLSLGSLSLSSRSLGSLSLSSPYSLFLPSGSSLSSLLLLLPFPFLSISAYTRTLSPTSPALSLPSPAYLLSSTFYPYSSYLYPLPSPPSLALPSLTLPILSPLPLRTKGMRGTLSSLWEGGEAQGTLIFHSPLGGRARGEIGIKYPRRRTHSGVRRLGSTSGEE